MAWENESKTKQIQWENLRYVWPRGVLKSCKLASSARSPRVTRSVSIAFPIKRYHPSSAWADGAEVFGGSQTVLPLSSSPRRFPRRSAGFACDFSLFFCAAVFTCRRAGVLSAFALQGHCRAQTRAGPLPHGKMTPKDTEGSRVIDSDWVTLRDQHT